MRRQTTFACSAVGAGAIFVAGWVAATPTAGCTIHQCDQSTSRFNGGRMIDDRTYETNGLDENWIPYPPSVTLIVDYSSIVGPNLVPVSIDSFIGISSLPNEAGSNWTNASGAVVENTSLDRNGFWAVNATCSGYFARFVVHFAPTSGDDAGADGAP